MFSVSDSKRHIQEYEPERVTPIYTYITKKYRCEENLLSSDEKSQDLLDTLTFNIKENDPSMVWKSVRLCMPVTVTTKGDSGNAKLRVADNLPTCNIAFAASAYEVFSDMQLVVNGSVFTSQPNRFQGMLDRVYRGRDVLSFQSGGALKPIVNRNLKTATEANGIFPVQGARPNQFVQVHDTYSSVSRNAFDLTQSNPGFITRAAQFQQDLNGSSDKAASVLSMYMDIGIFQNKERKLPSGRRLYNDACPYLRDVMIRCTYDKSGSKFDSKHCTKLAAGLDMFHNREMPSKLLEFATPVNVGILGEPALPVTNWSKYFSISLTEKPYIEVQFVQVPESTLKPSYSLMALRHQHEISDVFNFNFLVPGADGFAKQTVTQRINSRLLEVPSKIYIWAGLSFNDKKSFFLGNTGNQRNCEISRLHLRMNTRPDALFEPTQLECFNIFKRLSLNDMNYQTWSKSPIYVFDPQSLGQPEFLASDGQLMTYDWTCDISPTELINSEMLFLQGGMNRKAMGYDDSEFFTDAGKFDIPFVGDVRQRKYVNWSPNPAYYVAGQAANPWSGIKAWVPAAEGAIALTKRSVYISHYLQRTNLPQVFNQYNESLLMVNNPIDPPNLFTFQTEGTYLFRKPGQYDWNNELVPEEKCPEIWRIHQTLENRIRLDNFIWALWDFDSNSFYRPGEDNADQVTFWYVPESWIFTMTDRDQGTTTNGNFVKRKLFNSLDWVRFNADGSIVLDDVNHRPVRDTDDVLGQGIIQGRVAMTDVDGTLRQIRFNHVSPQGAGQACGYCPGPRAYPLSIGGAAAARTITGVRNMGMLDGGTGNQAGNNVLRGGIAYEAFIADANANNPFITYYKMINSTIDQEDENLVWLAFQPTYNQMNKVAPQSNFSRKLAFDSTASPGGQFPGIDGGAAPCGAISTPLNMQPNADAALDVAYIPPATEVHILKHVIERDVADTITRHPAQDIHYSIRGDAQGALDDRGAIMQYGGGDVMYSKPEITNDLEFSLNVLYEMGNDKYIVSKNGQMLQDNDVWTPTVLQKRARVASQAEIPERFTRDPRLERAMPKLEKVKKEPRSFAVRDSGFHSHY